MLAIITNCGDVSQEEEYGAIQILIRLINSFSEFRNGLLAARFCRRCSFYAMIPSWDGMNSCGENPA
jgi:hypothetical protein